LRSWTTLITDQLTDQSLSGIRDIMNINGLGSQAGKEPQTDPQTTAHCDCFDCTVYKCF